MYRKEKVKIINILGNLRKFFKKEKEKRNKRKEEGLKVHLGVE